MKSTLVLNRSLALPALILTIGLLRPDAASAITTVFFDSSQTTNLVAAGTTSDTISSEGYLFTLTRDKLFTGGVGLTNPIGRYLRVEWPDGLEAQAVTAGPVLSKARIDIQRQDGEKFAIQTFTAKLLANTSGAGGSIEVMPMLNGEDGVANPFLYNATGNTGDIFTYNTPELAGFDAYKITLYVDFALMGMIAIDPSLPPPTLDLFQLDAATIELSWPTNAVGYVLRSATDLSAQTWTAVTNVPDIFGDFYSVQLTMDGDQRFYRLQK